MRISAICWFLPELRDLLSFVSAFIDGNKRTAIASLAAHLAINGFWLRPDQLETYRFMMGLYESGRFRMAELEVWRRAHTEAALIKN